MKIKKPKFWDNRKISLISYSLIPFSKIVELISKYNFKKRKKLSGIKSICVGNIYIGGTGKTSLAIEIKKILDAKNIKSCFIKKLYSDQTDEKLILEQHGEVFVNHSRKSALYQAMKKDYKIAIFDDGLQDKELLYDLSIVCFNKKNEIGNGLVLPAGPLREKLDNIINYQTIVLNGNDENNLEFKKLLLSLNKDTSIFETKYILKNLKEFDLNNHYLAFSGIGNHKTFIEMLNKYNFKISKDLEFPDHYEYNQKDIENIKLLAEKENLKILTTKKDFFRISSNDKKNLRYVDIELKINNYENFEKEILKIDAIN